MLANAPVSAVLAVSDLQRAMDFYGNTLGLSKMDLPPEMEEQGVVFVAGQGTNLYIYIRPEGRDATNTVAGFMVDDVGAAVAALKAKGVTIEHVEFSDELTTDEGGIASVGEFQTAFIRDPDGNWLSINKMPA